MNEYRKMALILAGILIAVLIVGFSWRTLKSPKSSIISSYIELLG